jgi:hypothetical protein
MTSGRVSQSDWESWEFVDGTIAPPLAGASDAARAFGAGWDAFPKFPKFPKCLSLQRHLIFSYVLSSICPSHDGHSELDYHGWEPS